LHSMIAAVDHEQQTSMMVERHALRVLESAILAAILDGADRGLDSSITIGVDNGAHLPTRSQSYEISRRHDPKEIHATAHENS